MPKYEFDVRVEYYKPHVLVEADTYDEAEEKLWEAIPDKVDLGYLEGTTPVYAQLGYNEGRVERY
jgi:hypothetical protein